MLEKVVLCSPEDPHLTVSIVAISMFGRLNNLALLSLCIPSAFVAHMKGAIIADKALLRNRHGKLWPVEVTKVGYDLFFADGWVKFVEDNSVEFGDFLVFDYDGKNIFDIKLLGRTECEKGVIGSVDVKAKKQEEEEVEEEEEGQRGEEDDDDDADDEEDEEEEEEEEEEEVEIKTFRKKTEKGKSEKSTKGSKKINRGTNNGHKGKTAVKVEGGNKRTNATDIEDGDDVFEYGMVSRPKNPYFVAKLRPKRQSDLHVPSHVLRDHNLKLPKKLILLDKEGRKWSSIVRVWKDGRTWLAGGWKAFWKWNDVKPEDRCVCEFIQGEGKMRIFLKMRILRAGSWLPKKQSQSS